MINWGALGLVSVVSLVVSVLVVALTSLAIVGLSAREHATTGSGGGLSAGAGTAVAGVCVAAIVAVIGYGLYLLVAR